MIATLGLAAGAIAGSFVVVVGVLVLERCGDLGFDMLDWSDWHDDGDDDCECV